MLGKLASSALRSAPTSALGQAGVGAGVGAGIGFFNPGEKGRVGGAFAGAWRGGLAGAGLAGGSRYGMKMLVGGGNAQQKATMTALRAQAMEKNKVSLLKRSGTSIRASGAVGGGIVGVLGFGRRKSKRKNRNTTIASNSWKNGTHPMYFT